MSEEQFLSLPLLVASGILIANGITFLVRGSVTRYFRTKSAFWLFVSALFIALAVGLVGSSLMAVLAN